MKSTVEGHKFLGFTPLSNLFKTFIEEWKKVQNYPVKFEVHQAFEVLIGVRPQNWRIKEMDTTIRCPMVCMTVIRFNYVTNAVSCLGLDFARKLT